MTRIIIQSLDLIARSIIDAKGEDDDYVQTEYYEEDQDEGTPEDMFGGNTHIFTMNSIHPVRSFHFESAH